MALNATVQTLLNSWSLFFR